MWPIPALNHELVSISFSPDAVVCAWMQKTLLYPQLQFFSLGSPCEENRNMGLKGQATKSALLILRAYKNYPLTNLELENSFIFNQSVIKKYITSFLQEHGLQNAFITFSLCGPGVVEKFIAMPTSTPHRNDFDIAQVSTVQWEYRYLYPNDHGQYVFYVYSVPRLLILQYKLLAIATRCNLIAMTTKTFALVCAYKNIFGTAFRRSQLAVDMMRYDNNIDNLISVDALRRMVHISPEIDIFNERLCIATAGGLFCAEEEKK